MGKRTLTICLLLYCLSSQTWADLNENTGSVIKIEEGVTAVQWLYVDADAVSDPGPNDLASSDPDEEGTLEHPYDSIQEAIEVARDGDQIFVLSGTYCETIDFLGKSIHVTGFSPHVEAQRNQPCPIIDGNYQDTVVTFTGGEDDLTQLSGFTITRGKGRDAGGILCLGSHPQISNCLIVGNRATGSGGGGVYCHDSHARFDHCTISGNVAGHAGAGFYSDDSSQGLTNSILWYNEPTDIEYSMLEGSSLPSLFIIYCALPQEVFWATNIRCQPGFVSPGYWASVSTPEVPIDVPGANAIWIAGDYHLMSGSPCVNAGDPKVHLDANELDLDGQPRVAYERVDMGSDEYVCVDPGYVATCNNIVIPLFQDTSAVHPETAYVGRTTLTVDAEPTYADRVPPIVDAPKKKVLLPLVSAMSKAGGFWTVSLSSEEVGPGQCIEVELTVRGTGVDVNSLDSVSYNTVLAAVEVLDGLKIEFVSIGDPGVPEHEGFWGKMSKFEITNAQYCKYLNWTMSADLIVEHYGTVYGVHDTQHFWPYFDTFDKISTSQIAYSEGRFSVIRRDGMSMANHPVVEVSWFGARAFCDSFGYRLPTEWEWQAVADYDGSYVYGCGMSIDQSRANYWDGATANPHGMSEYPHTSRVGYYPSNGYGLHDLAGNVWEWTDTAISSRDRILCGGAWTQASGQNEVSYRGSYNAFDTFHAIGFRVCR